MKEKNFLKSLSLNTKMLPLHSDVTILTISTSTSKSFIISMLYRDDTVTKKLKFTVTVPPKYKQRYLHQKLVPKANSCTNLHNIISRWISENTIGNEVMYADAASWQWKPYRPKVQNQSPTKIKQMDGTMHEMTHEILYSKVKNNIMWNQKEREEIPNGMTHKDHHLHLHWVAGKGWVLVNIMPC